MMGEIDYKYTLDLYKRISGISVGGQQIHDFFVVDGYNYWQFYEQRVFEDIKAFSKEKKFRTSRKTLVIHIKDFIANLFLVIFSLTSFFVLCVRKRAVLMYSVDRVNSTYKNDFRLDEIYQFLAKYNIGYIEIFHAIINKNVFTNLFKRRRIGFYLESLEWVGGICVVFGFGKNTNTDFLREIDFSIFSEDEREFVHALVTRYARQIRISQFKIYVLQKLLPYTGVQVLFAIDDARYYYEVLLGCQLAHITTYAFQHGHFTKYHVGWLDGCALQGEHVCPDTYVVWSHYWKNELIRLGSPFKSDSILVGGTKAMQLDYDNTQCIKSETITILIPFETACPKSEVSVFIHKMLECSAVKVIFKLRPDISKDEQLAEYHLTSDFHKHFSVVTDIHAVIGDVDIVAGVYSTFLYDMIAYEKHVVILETSSDYGEGMIINGLADKITLCDSLCDSLWNIINFSDKEVEKRKCKLYGESNKKLSNTLHQIALKHDIVQT